MYDFVEKRIIMKSTMQVSACRKEEEIAFENQCNVGDIVEVGGFRGTIQEIGLRTTSLVDGGGNIKIINNGDMKNILNRSDKGSFAVCDVGIPYETDLVALESQLPAVLNAIYESEKETMNSAPRHLGVQTPADSAVALRFAADVREESIFAAQRRLNRALLLGLRSVGVECPFPQIDVHSR